MISLESNLITENKIIILLYHQVGFKPNANTNLDCFCDINEFRKQMVFLKDNGFKVISLQSACYLIKQKKNPIENYVVLTFDDGCEKFYDWTFPILNDFNYPATIYPVSSSLGKNALWPSINNPDLNILSKRKLRELEKLGVEVGAHSLNHSKLTTITNDALHDEVYNSKVFLEQLLGKPIHSFSYPHGKFNNEVIEMVKDAGFTNAVTCQSGFAQDSTSMYTLNRKYITYFDNLEKFETKLRING